MPISIKIVGEERWTLAKQMRHYLRELEKATEHGKIDRGTAQAFTTYETVIAARLKGLPEPEVPK